MFTIHDPVTASELDAAGAVMNSDTTTAAMSFVVDEDNMASDSATKVPTQQSVKAYADSLKGDYATFYVQAGAMTPRTTNGAATSTEEYATNDVMFDELLFDKDTEEGAQFQVMMPDEWDLGNIKAKFYWDVGASASASETVCWGLSGRAVANDEAIDAAFGASTDTTDTVIAVGDMHISAASSAITVAGTPALGKLCLFEVTRVVGSDDAADDAKLFGIGIQYKKLSTAVASW